MQLAGNHEAQYLTPPKFHWPERLPEDDLETLFEWWRSRRMRVATAVEVAGEPYPYLVTHAGLTEGFWRHFIGMPESASAAASSLNGLVGRLHENWVYRPGVMLTGEVSLSAGPLWASAPDELLPSWLASAAPAPFNQVHGHSSTIDWVTGRRYGHLEERVQIIDDPLLRHSHGDRRGSPDHRHRPRSWPATGAIMGAAGVRRCPGDLARECGDAQGSATKEDGHGSSAAGRRALVTGGSRGIGKAVAAALIAEGAVVTICARHREAVESAAAELGATAVVADTGSDESVRELVARATDAMGGIDILVNAAADPGGQAPPPKLARRSPPSSSGRRQRQGDGIPALRPGRRAADGGPAAGAGSSTSAGSAPARPARPSARSATSRSRR